MNLVCLIGQQPIPNLLPILHLKPQQVLLVHTGNEGSFKAARRLQKLSAQKQIAVELLNVGDAYRLKEIYDKLRQRVNSQLEADWCFNLTGGTKLMSLAATQAAADFNLPCVYYQTEAERQQQVGKLLYYRFEERRLIEDPSGGEVLLPLLTLDDYLRAHLDDYTCREQSDSKLEEAVYQALQPHVDEILCNVRPEGVKDQVEIDLLIRIGNQVGVIEVKSGGKGSGKKAVDQLTTAAAREYLGTYALRFLVTQWAQEDRFKELAKALRVNVIELRDYCGKPPLNQQDKHNLLTAIRQRMPKFQ
jgi:hypothetical protein